MDHHLEKQTAKISFRSIFTDRIQFCLSIAYPKNQAVKHENSKISLLSFPMPSQVCLIGESMNSVEYFVLDRHLKVYQYLYFYNSPWEFWF